jgi:signal transduction histidine kinase
MICPLRILSLEDDAQAVELIGATLESDGFKCQLVHVETERAFLRALNQEVFDVILADYALPGFDGLTALSLARIHAPEVPFIFVSGTLGEEVAIESLKVGATDYVLKQRLTRLAPAVRRALSEAVQRKERREAESALRQSEASLRRHREQLRELAAHLVSVQEAEQKRLARELHDGLNQELAVVSVGLEKLHLAIPPQAKPLKKQTQELVDCVARISDDVHRMAYRLHPAVLENLGLPTALETECRHFTEREGIRIDFEEDNHGPRLPEPVSLCLYRVAQESLRNIARHSDTCAAEIHLTVTPDQVRLCIRDYGAGFDLANLGKTRGLGLISMEERVHQVNGKLAIESNPGKGTRVEVTVPLMSVSEGTS